MADTEAVEVPNKDAATVPDAMLPSGSSATAATLDEVFGAEGDEKPGIGQFVAPESRPKEAKEEQPEADGKPQDAEPDEKFSAAFQALLTSGVPAEALKNASRATVLRWHEKQAKREADIQLAFQERADFKKQIDEKAKETTTKDGERPSGTPTPSVDLTAALAPIIEQYGEELGKPLEAYGQKIIEATMAAMESKYAARIGGMDQGSALARELLIESTRERLVERFPKLSDDTEFATKVLPKIEALAKTGAYADAAPTIRGQALACMADACGLIYGASPSSDAEMKSSVNRSKDAGQPSLRTNRVPGKQKSLQDKAWAAFNASEDGDIERARRIMSS